MKKIKYLIITFFLMLGFFVMLAPAGVGASEATKKACNLDPNSALCKDNSPTAVPNFVKALVNVLLFVLSAVCVIVIIIAGFFYATSSGDSALVTKAKNTLLYAVVGLIVAIMSFAIVNFVTTNFIV